MLGTEEGIATDVSDVQPEKAWFSILVTELGIVTDASEVQ
jgi:hypothetical protein